MWLKAILLFVYIGATSGCTTYKVAMQSLSGCANSENNQKVIFALNEWNKGYTLKCSTFTTAHTAKTNLNLLWQAP